MAVWLNEQYNSALLTVVLISTYIYWYPHTLLLSFNSSAFVGDAECLKESNESDNNNIHVQYFLY
jgi:hypothetical protein